MPDNAHFEFPSSWDEAADLVNFKPVGPANTGGRDLQSFAVFVRDHKFRELARENRNLEVYYDGFSFSQSRQGVEEARRMALEVSYGRAPGEALVAGHEARVYELGPVPAADDIDPRSPAVVVWCDGDMFFLMASDSLQSDVLLPIAASIY